MEAADNLERALSAWREVVGEEHVVTDPEELAAAQTATFLTTERIPAIVRPASREEVQRCVLVANEHGVPVYPVSRGKNWAYGSRVPPKSGCVLLELFRMDGITDYDERLAYVRVEPGVTLAQLYEFLRSRGSKLMVSVTGGPPDSSLVGNALERGAASGPLYDRFSHVCNFEVVLPTGECVNTGFGRFPEAKTASLHRYGVGLSLDGIFAQSNLGIVTAMTVWLAPLPEYFQSCFFGIEDEERLEGLIDALQGLQLRGLFRAGVTVRNTLNVMSRMQQYPWEALEGESPMPEVFLEVLRKSIWRSAWWSSLWIGWAELYCASREQGMAERTIIKEALGERVDRLAFVDEEGVEISRWDTPGEREAIESYFEPESSGEASSKDSSEGSEVGSSLGVPSEGSVFSTYWRKKSAPPAKGLDPDRDLCGVMFCVPTLPYEGRHVREALKIAKESLAGYGFEPILIVGCFSARVIYLDAAIHFDREVPGEDDRAMACHDELLGRMIEEGYIPYRLSTRSVGLLPEPRDDYNELLRRLKQALDPNGILAPGRYGIP